jgi:hypothetical protein
LCRPVSERIWSQTSGAITEQGVNSAHNYTGAEP